MTQIYYLTLSLADKSLPAICQRSNCLLDVTKGKKYCQKHLPKPKKDLIKPIWFKKYVVYMIKIEGEPYIKIGVAKDFSSRLSSLQVGNPRKIEVIAVLQAGSSSESLLHRELQDHSIRGEWFIEAPV